MYQLCIALLLMIASTRGMSQRHAFVSIDISPNLTILNTSSSSIYEIKDSQAKWSIAIQYGKEKHYSTSLFLSYGFDIRYEDYDYSAEYTKLVGDIELLVRQEFSEASKQQIVVSVPVLFGFRQLKDKLKVSVGMAPGYSLFRRTYEDFRSVNYFRELGNNSGHWIRLNPPGISGYEGDFHIDRFSLDALARVSYLIGQTDKHDWAISTSFLGSILDDGSYISVRRYQIRFGVQMNFN